MLDGFEDITEELTEDELKYVLPPVVNGFKNHGKNNPIKASDIVQKMKGFCSDKKMDIKFNDVKLRKFVHHIRIRGLLPLLASSKGYYCSYDKAEIKGQIDSLNQRANSISNAAKGLSAFIQS